MQTLFLTAVADPLLSVHRASSFRCTSGGFRWTWPVCCHLRPPPPREWAIELVGVEVAAVDTPWLFCAASRRFGRSDLSSGSGNGAAGAVVPGCPASIRTLCEGLPSPVHVGVRYAARCCHLFRVLHSGALGESRVRSPESQSPDRMLSRKKRMPVGQVALGPGFALRSAPAGPCRRQAAFADLLLVFLSGS